MSVLAPAPSQLYSREQLASVLPTIGETNPYALDVLDACYCNGPNLSETFTIDDVMALLPNTPIHEVILALVYLRDQCGLIRFWAYDLFEIRINRNLHAQIQYAESHV